jgi:hypothetical protein
MGAPTAHQVEDGAALRKQLRVELADLGNRAIIYVNQEARHRVESLILGVVDAAKKLGFKISGHFHRAFCFRNLEGAGAILSYAKNYGQFERKCALTASLTCLPMPV